MLRFHPGRQPVVVKASERISGKKLSYNVAHQLGVAIVTGKHTVEAPIPTEADLCNQFNVSRGVIREAIKVLDAKGLVDISSPRGTRIRPESVWNKFDPDVLCWLLARRLSAQSLIQFTQFRLAIEPGAAALAAQVAADSERAAIRIALVRVRAAQCGDDDPLEANIAFHDALLQASGNPFYAQLSLFIATGLRSSTGITNRHRGVMVASVEDHVKIANAVMKRKPTAAAAAMRALIQDVLDRIERRQSHRPCHRL